RILFSRKGEERAHVLAEFHRDRIAATERAWRLELEAAEGEQARSSPSIGEPADRRLDALLSSLQLLSQHTEGRWQSLAVRHAQDGMLDANAVALMRLKSRD